MGGPGAGPDPRLVKEKGAQERHTSKHTEEPLLLPSGWRSEYLGEGYHLIFSPKNYMITVDFDRRGYRVGLARTGFMTSTQAYNGRGWKRALVDAAVAHLRSIADCPQCAR